MLVGSSLIIRCLAGEGFVCPLPLFIIQVMGRWGNPLLLAVDFLQPRTLVMLWFELHFGTNPPLGILMI
jgi:hypothetical protein